MKKELIAMGVISALCWAQPAFAARAVALLTATQEGSQANGEAVFQETPEGLDIEVRVADAPPGKHGFHIHEKGDCSDHGNAAGGHYNPDKVKHGLITKDGFPGAHPGDLGNIEVAEDGTGTLKVFVPHLTLTKDEYNVEGKAVILHEKEDDFTQPTGNAGARIGCGVIMLKDEADSRAEDGLRDTGVFSFPNKNT